MNKSVYIITNNKFKRVHHWTSETSSVSYLFSAGWGGKVQAEESCSGTQHNNHQSNTLSSETMWLQARLYYAD